MKLSCALALLLLAASAEAAVGTLSALEGTATRTSRGGAAAAIKEGDSIEVGDVIRVGSGDAKLTLNDGSVLILAGGSDLEITEADFAGQERRSFAAKLGLGALWAKVTKVVAGTAKFEISTERAVAGVRGTVFTVEVPPDHETRVNVIEGRVEVRRQAPPPPPMAIAARAPQAPVVARTAAAPTAPESVMVGPGEGVAVRADALLRGAAPPLPERFEKFISAHEAERGDPELRRERHESHRERHFR